MTSNAPNGRQMNLLQLYSGGRIIYRLPNTVNLCTRSQNAYVRGAGLLTKSSAVPIFGMAVRIQTCSEIWGISLFGKELPRLDRIGGSKQRGGLDLEAMGRPRGSFYTDVQWRLHNPT